MRQPLISVVVLVAAALAGCSTHRNTPYANDPVLLHYKPTLNDSATIIAEKQWHHSPAKPPKPPVAQDKIANELAISLPPVSPVAGPLKPASADQLLPPPPGMQMPSVALTPEASGPPLPVRPTAPEPPSIASTPVAVSEPPASPISVPPPETGPTASLTPPPPAESAERRNAGARGSASRKSGNGRREWTGFEIDAVRNGLVRRRSSDRAGQIWT